MQIVSFVGNAGYETPECGQIQRTAACTAQAAVFREHFSVTNLPGVFSLMEEIRRDIIKILPYIEPVVLTAVYIDEPEIAFGKIRCKYEVIVLFHVLDLRNEIGICKVGCAREREDEILVLFQTGFVNRSCKCTDIRIAGAPVMRTAERHEICNNIHAVLKCSPGGNTAHRKSAVCSVHSGSLEICFRGRFCIGGIFAFDKRHNALTKFLPEVLCIVECIATDLVEGRRDNNHRFHVAVLDHIVDQTLRFTVIIIEQ